MANDTPRKERYMAQDTELIKKVKNLGDGESLKKLISKHSGIYVDMVNKYIPSSIEGIRKQDVLEEKDLCIYNAILSYDKTKKTKFSTYLGNLAKWRCLNMYNKYTKFPQQSLENTNVQNYSCDPEIKSIEDLENITNIFQIVSRAKDPRVKIIFKMRYSNEKKLTPWKKIAKKLDLSIQGCINIHNNYLEEIKKYV